MNAFDRRATRAVVWAAAFALAAFAGPSSARGLAWTFAEGDAASRALAIAARVAGALLLVPLLDAVRIVAARTATARLGIPDGVARSAEVLALAPFVLLAAAFVPGLWGDPLDESYSFAMLFLFVAVCLTSLGLRLGAPLAAARPRPIPLALGYAGFGLAVLVGTGLARPFDVVPHWTVPTDESPYWPTDAYLATFAAWFAFLSAPLLAIPGVLLIADRRAGAWATTAVLSVACIAGALATVAVDRRAHDRAVLDVRYRPGDAFTAWGDDGHAHEIRVLGAPDGDRWLLTLAAADGPYRLALRLGAPREAASWAHRCRPVRVALAIDPGDGTLEHATEVVHGPRCSPRRPAWRDHAFASVSPRGPGPVRVHAQVRDDTAGLPVFGVLLAERDARPS